MRQLFEHEDNARVLSGMQVDAYVAKTCEGRIYTNERSKYL
ncbi:MAG: hypothetical protein U0T83_01280 [Bacteriovoracaceae bacterium]